MRKKLSRIVAERVLNAKVALYVTSRLFVQISRKNKPVVLKK